MIRKALGTAVVSIGVVSCGSGVTGETGGAGGTTTSSSTTTTTTSSSTTSGTTTSSTTTSSTTTSSTTTSSSSSGAGGGSCTSAADCPAPEICSSQQCVLPPCTNPPGQLAQGQEGPSTCLCLSEAPANLAKMAMDAATAYASTHMVCASALAIPAQVPAGEAYQPSLSAGSDFQTGDATTGWQCIGFSVSTIATPIHCRYAYSAGSGYLGPALGGPDPGPTGFELSAQGDWNDNGAYSTFTIAGTIAPDNSGTLTLSPLFENKPLE